VEGKFFVSGGDAAEGLKPSKKVFDAVAFVIEMLVKGRFFGSTGISGYDGGAAELVHISTDGIAVVALIHDGPALRLEVCMQEGFALVIIGNVGCRQQEALGIAEGVTGQMNFSRETGSGSAHGLCELSAGRAGGVLVHPDRGTVNHQVFVVGAFFAQDLKDSLPQAAA